MPSSVAAALSARLREVAAAVGPGWPVGTGPVAALDAAGARLTDVSAGTAAAWRAVEPAWRGLAAERASALTAETVSAVDELAGDLDRISAATARASAAVATARERLAAIVAEFERRAAALEAELDEPEAEAAVASEGRRALDAATAVVDDLETELDGQAAAITPAPGPAPTVPQSASAPAGFGVPSLPSFGAGPGLGGGAGGLGAGALGSGGLGTAGLGAQAAGWPGHDEAFGRGTREPTPDAGVFGSGVSVTLPDGTRATAPNAVAASAVRHALTQLGVPYHWGGTTPGVGLDCSGLTQWAYHEAGLDLPRLAQEQDIGAAVSRGSLRPGDLAVWDGHVAMVVGNGLMIEAGDPVKLSPIRTTNAGQGFQGFWRPTG